MIKKPALFAWSFITINYYLQT